MTGSGRASLAMGPRAGDGIRRGVAGRTAPDDHGIDPCAALRRLCEQRCALAAQARAAAERARVALAEAQRSYDERVAAAERAAAAVDGRTIQAAKEAARTAFRQARARARDAADLEAAARAWLSEINRINTAARRAAAELERARAAVAELAPQVEALALRADAARIAAEAAAEGCLAARSALADCEETARGGWIPGSLPGAPPGPEPASPIADQQGGSSPGGELPPLSGDPLVLRLVRGDPGVMELLTARLAEDDPTARARWGSILAAFVAALRAQAVEASVLVFPPDHPFWRLFTPHECREIAAALAALGFRFDGQGGWVDDRRPTQRDLALAVGYAGLDPMRIRRWPREDEILSLFEGVTVAADKLLAERAGGLTLGELVALLGPRADGLTDLWNAWGRVRPIFLALA